MKKYKHIFGPVNSRRLGWSLGVDLVPNKICSMNCIYCEVGRTTLLTNEIKEYFPAEEVIEELKEILPEVSWVDFITITGSGEPTLYYKIRDISKWIKENSNIPLALLTNSTLFSNPEVRKDLLYFDVVVPSLDSAIEKTFKKINRPHKSIKLINVVKGLTEFRKEFKNQIWLEILVIKDYNDNENEWQALKDTIEKIKPDKVQIGTIDRPPLEQYAQPVSDDLLKKMAQFIGNNAEVINHRYKFSSDNLKISKRNLFETLKRRPLRLDELSSIMGISISDAEKWLLEYEKRGVLKKQKEGNNIFYSLNLK